MDLSTPGLKAQADRRYALGHDAAAAIRYRQALATVEQTRGAEHPEVAASLSGLAQRNRQWIAADHTFDQTLQDLQPA